MWPEYLKYLNEVFGKPNTFGGEIVFEREKIQTSFLYGAFQPYNNVCWSLPSGIPCLKIPRKLLIQSTLFLMLNIYKNWVLLSFLNQLEGIFRHEPLYIGQIFCWHFLFYIKFHVWQIITTEIRPKPSFQTLFK